MVEPPGGAELRDHPAFPFWARGKRSIVLDLKQKRDLDVLRQLLARADVFLHNLIPGAVERLMVLDCALESLAHELLHFVDFAAVGASDHAWWKDSGGWNAIAAYAT